MTKFMINNSTDARKTDANSLNRLDGKQSFLFLHKPFALSSRLGLILFTDGVFKEHSTHEQAAGRVVVPGFRGGTSSYAAQHVDPGGSWE